MSPRPAEVHDHLTGAARAWDAEGEQESFGGQTIHVRRRVGGAPLLLLLHGFPTSSFDWHVVLAQDRQHAAVTFDYLGLGCSDKPAGHDYDLASQADVAERLIAEHSQGRTVLLVAHDLGASIATELIARDLEGKLEMELTGALIVNGSIVAGDAARARARKLMHVPLGALLGGERHFRHELARYFSSEHKLDKRVAADQWSLLSHKDGHRIVDDVLAYLDTSEAQTERWRGAFRDWEKPINLLWGMRDPVVTPAVLDGLRELRPGVEATELDDVGHYPHLEAPDRVMAEINEAIDKARAAAGR